MKDWWKYLTIGLLLYTIVFSLYRPLKPGISGVSKDILSVGENTVELYGYNTHFPKDNAISAWLKSGESEWCASSVETISDEQLNITIQIPEQLPSHAVNLFVQYNEALLLLENAFHVNETTPGIAGSDKSCQSQNQVTAANNMLFPNRNILNETIRNLMFHVPMWFSMMLLMIISVIYSIRYLSGFNAGYDLIARQAVYAGLLFGILGLMTGSLWARFTWGQWWVSDTKLNGAAITTLIYLAYIILRGSIQEEQSRARISAVYNIFAFVILVVMLMILPRLNDSLHPGNGGNPAFSKYDLDNSLRMVFYPAVMGWIGISLWILQIRIRMARIVEKTENR